MNEALPTAAEISRLPQELKAKIAARSRQKGSNYERQILKKLGNYFGISDWKEVGYRTQPHGRSSQPEGDLKLINAVGGIWRAAGLGPLELKNRQEWSFDQVFKNAAKSYIYGYWKKSNSDTNSENSVVVFTKPGVSDLVLHACEKCEKWHQARLVFEVNQGQTGFVRLTVVTFGVFLGIHFPDPRSLL